MKTAIKPQSTGPDVLNMYMRDIARIPQLSVEEERALALAARAGDAEALRRLVESNLRFVVSMARKYARSGYPLHELVNEGNLGLMEAAIRFDPAENVRFVTYAGWWVRQAMLEAIAHYGQAFRLPAKLKHELYQFEKAVSRLTQSLGRKPSISEIAAALEMSEDYIVRMMTVIPKEISLGTPVGDEGDPSLEEFIEDPNAVAPDQAIQLQSFDRQFEHLLSQLSERERFIVERRFGLGDFEPQTLAEIGDDLRLSRERIRQIEERALAKMRRVPEARQLLACLN